MFVHISIDEKHNFMIYFIFMNVPVHIMHIIAEIMKANLYSYHVIAMFSFYLDHYFKLSWVEHI